jgi:hypothetical protein
VRLWFNDHEQERPLPAQNLENTITLSEAFYKEIDEHRIPAEREVIATRAHAPGLLDFYVWVVWKSWTVYGKPACVPLFGPEPLQNSPNSEPYDFRKNPDFRGVFQLCRSNRRPESRQATESVRVLTGHY